MNTKGKTAIKESKTKITASTLIRLAGLSAMWRGLCFIVLGMIHPLNVLSVSHHRSVGHHPLSLQRSWASLACSALRGSTPGKWKRSGWLGLAGYLLFSVFWMIADVAFHSSKPLSCRVLATVAPKFVEGFLGMVTGSPQRG